MCPKCNRGRQEEQRSKTKEPWTGLGRAASGTWLAELPWAGMAARIPGTRDLISLKFPIQVAPSKGDIKLLTEDLRDTRLRAGTTARHRQEGDG